MAKKNYIIGKAEVLTSLTPPPKMNPQAREIYTFQEVLDRLIPKFDRAAKDLGELNPDTCPRDFSVVGLTLHPSYLAKGHFPKKLFREMGVRSIGSKGTEVKPDKWTRKGEPTLSPTTSIFVAGKKEQLIQFGQSLKYMDVSSPCSEDLMKVWSVDAIPAKEKIKHLSNENVHHFEIGLQLIPDVTNDFIKTSFLSYAKALGFSPKTELSLEISNLWFVPIIGNKDRLHELAQYSFVRVVREIPPLRNITSITRSFSATEQITLPTMPPLSSDVKVAILDGGLPSRNGLAPWLNDYRLSDPTADDCENGPDHGLGVTSAFLFGPLKPGRSVSRPFSYVDHYRIVDSEIASENPLDLYRTLTHIEDVLISRQYEFINISLGPNLPIDDDEIHPWTALLDNYLSDGDTFLTVAAGNNGENDCASDLNRIQVPSDSVNAITVGAADNTGAEWSRATYSAVGPGRAPGRVKPDIVTFGGSHLNYFHVLNDSGGATTTVPQRGTSFAAPYLLRKAVGIRSLFGHDISPLAIKALLINSASKNEHPEAEVGWGKTPDDISNLIESPDGVAKILYQNELLPGKYVKVPVPLPELGINGKVKIKATCCISAPTDPQDTSMYTKAGVEISWSPNGKRKESFFQQVKRANEAELRRDAAKWETVLHQEKKKIGSKLDEPYFEIHYMARDGGADISGNKAPKIKYAFVITLEAPKHKTIFSDIMDVYSEILSEIQPRVSQDIAVNI